MGIGSEMQAASGRNQPQACDPNHKNAVFARVSSPPAFQGNVQSNTENLDTEKEALLTDNLNLRKRIFDLELSDLALQKEISQLKMLVASSEALPSNGTILEPADRNVSRQQDEKGLQTQDHQVKIQELESALTKLATQSKETKAEVLPPCIMSLLIHYHAMSRDQITC